MHRESLLQLLGSEYAHPLFLHPAFLSLRFCPPTTFARDSEGPTMTFYYFNRPSQWSLKYEVIIFYRLCLDDARKWNKQSPVTTWIEKQHGPELYLVLCLLHHPPVRRQLPSPLVLPYKYDIYYYFTSLGHTAEYL